MTESSSLILSSHFLENVADCSTEDCRDKAVVELRGQLSISSVLQFKQEITALVQIGARHMVVDLTEVDYLDSVGLGSLMGARKKVVMTGGTFALVVGHDVIFRLFGITGLSNLFKIFRDSEEALIYLQERGK